jgi:hypothetical protein
VIHGLRIHKKLFFRLIRSGLADSQARPAQAMSASDWLVPQDSTTTTTNKLPTRPRLVFHLRAHDGPYHRPALGLRRAQCACNKEAVSAPSRLESLQPHVALTDTLGEKRQKNAYKAGFIFLATFCSRRLPELSSIFLSLYLSSKLTTHVHHHPILSHTPRSLLSTIIYEHVRQTVVHRGGLSTCLVIC